MHLCCVVAKACTLVSLTNAGASAPQEPWFSLYCLCHNVKAPPAFFFLFFSASLLQDAKNRLQKGLLGETGSEDHSPSSFFPLPPSSL